MAYRRYSRRRRFSRRKAPWYKRKYNAMQLAAKAAKGVWYLKGLVNSEMMHKDNIVSLGNQRAAIFNLTDIDQGDYPYQRTGNSVLLRSIALNGYSQINSNVSAATRYCIALVQDTQQIADTTPAVGDIFSTPDDTYSLLNLSHAGRFKILYRKQFTLFPAAGGGASKQHRIFKKFRLHVRFNGTGTSDNQKNGIYLVMLTSEGTNFPTISFNTRTSYHDN